MCKNNWAASPLKNVVLLYRSLLLLWKHLITLLKVYFFYIFTKYTKRIYFDIVYCALRQLCGKRILSSWAR